MAKFRKIDLSIERASGYGSYIIVANYKGKKIRVFTHNSECYDWLDDDSNKEMHQEAKRYAYNQVVKAYENFYK
ncbi:MULTISPECIES: hypothetical protein [Weeksella]|uniref:hypothetical protein n=1 Tax=Weeksella TaxID=1013 RepID=UPI0008A520B5|nr:MULTISPECIES: hypothetical protein [Weeksella]MDK7375981.1 hypothetical protein [Weeksella virosa]OFM84575.1 hypothetical protein HMPREF2660_08675 [Weeksella sp. HMSC059D05]